MTKLLVAFRNFANAPKMANFSLSTPWRRIDGVEVKRRSFFNQNVSSVA
jgi:hypothetical protein